MGGMKFSHQWNALPSPDIPYSYLKLPVRTKLLKIPEILCLDVYDKNTHAFSPKWMWWGRWAGKFPTSICDQKWIVV